MKRAVLGLMCVFVVCGTGCGAKSVEYTSIHDAAKGGDQSAVKRFLKQGADVNATNEQGLTPLLSSVFYGHMEIARLLVEHGADVNVGSERNSAPLMMASESGGVDIAVHGTTPLIWVARKGNIRMVEFLVEKGASVMGTDYNGATPLMGAAIKGHLAVAKYLVDKGADINAKEGDGITPLACAVTGGDVEMVKYLLDRGADINAEYSGTTILMAADEASPPVAALLKSRGAKR